MREMSVVETRLRWAGQFLGALAYACLCVACSDDPESCDTSPHGIVATEQSALGFSSKEVLAAHPKLSAQMRWEEFPEWFPSGVSGQTEAEFVLEKDTEPFIANSIDECARYLGTPVSISLTTQDGVVNATAAGELRAFAEEELELRAVFKSRDISGTLAPTDGVDLVVRLLLHGEAREGTLSARVTRMTENSLSVKQVEIGTFGDFPAIADAGLDAAPAMSEPEPVILPPAPSAAPSDAGETDTGIVEDAAAVPTHDVTEDAAPGQVGDAAGHQASSRFDWG